MEDLEEVINRNIQVLKNVTNLNFNESYNGIPYTGLNIKFDNYGEIYSIDSLGSNGIIGFILDENYQIINIFVKEGHKYVKLDESKISKIAKKALNETIKRYNSKNEIIHKV